MGGSTRDFGQGFSGIAMNFDGRATLIDVEKMPGERADGPRGSGGRGRDGPQGFGGRERGASEESGLKELSRLHKAAKNGNVTQITRIISWYKRYIEMEVIGEAKQNDAGTPSTGEKAIEEAQQDWAVEEKLRGMINSQDFHRRTPLHLAAYFGHAEAVKRLIDEKADFKQTASDEYNALHFASQKGHVEVVKALVNASFVQSEGKLDFLCRTVKKKRTDERQALYMRGSALYLALQNGHASCVEFLAAAGCTIDGSFEERNATKALLKMKLKVTEEAKKALANGVSECARKRQKRGAKRQKEQKANAHRKFAKFDRSATVTSAEANAHRKLVLSEQDVQVGTRVKFKSSKEDFIEAFRHCRGSVGMGFYWDDLMESQLGKVVEVLDRSEGEGIFGIEEATPDSGQPIWWYPFTVIESVEPAQSMAKFNRSATVTSAEAAEEPTPPPTPPYTGGADDTPPYAGDADGAEPTLAALKLHGDDGEVFTAVVFTLTCMIALIGCKTFFGACRGLQKPSHRFHERFPEPLMHT